MNTFLSRSWVLCVALVCFTPISVFANKSVVINSVNPTTAFPEDAVTSNTSGGVCMVDRYNGDRFVIGDNLNPSFPGSPKTTLGCNSGDVSLVIYEVVEGPTECIAGETIQVRLKGDFRATSAERWDVGVFISEDGTSPNTLGGSCYSDYLHPVSADNTDLDLISGGGPFYNGEITEDIGDVCGDIQQGNDATFVTGWISIQCKDSDGDALADVASCTVWANSTSDGSLDKPSCNDEFDVSADTTAKCTCEDVNIVGIDFVQTAEIEVVKNLTPSDDPGLFNLQVDASDEATDVGNGGTTGVVSVGAGTFNHPGASHSVGETAGTNTSLNSYFTSIECVDRGLSTFGGTCDGGSAGICDGGTSDGRICLIGDAADDCVLDGGACVTGFACDPMGTADSDACLIGGGSCTANVGPLTMDGSGPLEVPVSAGQDIVCTISNTNGCETTVCDDSACAILTCDPTGVVGNCDTVEYTVGALCRQGTGDACDPDEVCIDQNLDCPADKVTNAGTVCNPGSGDACDPDEVCSGSPGDACPVDGVANAGTVCNPGSGDACDPDEVCSGVPDQACPDDGVANAGTVCNPGSGDLCDPDEVCSGVADQACPVDGVANAGTVCNPGSGDLCDPDEVCSGVADQACPDDGVANAGTVCNPGSGDACDPDEVCSGAADQACPDDGVADAGTVCNPGSGDLCDPDEECSGLADQACPDDGVANAGTVCNPGSGDACDPDEVCSGEADQACPDDGVADAGTVCNLGSGDLCDPDEVCSGSPDDACPDDSFDDGNTVCNQGSGDLCDPDELCPGIADAACPDDNVTNAGTVCDVGSGDLCDPDEVCSGVADEICPSDTVTDQGTLCRTGSGDICDADEVCTGVAEEACPDDDAPANAGNLCRNGNGVDICDQDELCSGTPGATCPDDDALNNAGLVCRESGTGFEDCDPAEVCIGQPGSVCPDDYIEPPGTSCGDQSTTQCTKPDTCNDAGICLNNNQVCGSVTNSSLCEYDMEPTKGTCAGGTEPGSACFITDPCVLAGGVCDIDTCIGGLEDGLACTPPSEGACELGGGICEQSDQFRLLFSPDVKNWAAYKLDASNPGQTFYNLMYDASGAGDSDVKLTVTIPYPYVTVGGMPLHIYDGEAVGSNGQGCLDPAGGIRSEPMFITLDDWIFGAPGDDYNLVCDLVAGPNGSGFCTFDVNVLNSEIPESGLLYVNLHLDHGLKGKSEDANPYGNDPGTGDPEDRYDRYPLISPWGSSDALVNTITDDGPLALADCQAYWFDHTDDVAAGYCIGGVDDGFECVVEVDACAEAGGLCNVDTCEGGDMDGEVCKPIDCSDGDGICVATPLFEDKIENLNIFNKISGLFGRAYCADDGTGFAYHLRLVHPKKGVVEVIQAASEGFFVFTHVHKGKQTMYTMEIATDSEFNDIVSSADVSLGSSGWYDVSFSATDCAGSPVWESTVAYGGSSKKNGKR